MSEIDWSTPFTPECLHLGRPFLVECQDKNGYTEIFEVLKEIGAEFAECWYKDGVVSPTPYDEYHSCLRFSRSGRLEKRGYREDYNGYTDHLRFTFYPEMFTMPDIDISGSPTLL